ncbi:superoxide dismutase [Erysipelotrichaceae bacterium OttesenSCG-928-M19]|nr:superoxide dismutase [Erysipelotrichaceae bacterium OttesenSCG-928-M19]
MKEFKLQKLDYEYDALEPYIDALTMEIHHSRHHQAYTNNFNAALEDVADIVKDLAAEEIIADVHNLIPEAKRQAIINNGGGYLNHNLFFDILGPDNHQPQGKLAQAIDQEFGSYDNFKEEFKQAAISQFGSGWAWLVVSNGTLQIIKTANQDSPLSLGKTPILGIDVWEHAYYLNYQNKRPEYIDNFFNVIDFKKVNQRYEAAL